MAAKACSNRAPVTSACSSREQLGSGSCVVQNARRSCGTSCSTSGICGVFQYNPSIQIRCYTQSCWESTTRPPPPARHRRHWSYPCRCSGVPDGVKQQSSLVTAPATNGRDNRVTILIFAPDALLPAARNSHRGLPAPFLVPPRTGARPPSPIVLQCGSAPVLHACAPSLQLIWPGFSSV